MLSCPKLIKTAFFSSKIGKLIKIAPYFKFSNLYTILCLKCDMFFVIHKQDCSIKTYNYCINNQLYRVIQQLISNVSNHRHNIYNCSLIGFQRKFFLLCFLSKHSRLHPQSPGYGISNTQQVQGFSHLTEQPQLLRGGSLRKVISLKMYRGIHLRWVSIQPHSLSEGGLMVGTRVLPQICQMTTRTP